MARFKALEHQSTDSDRHGALTRGLARVRSLDKAFPDWLQIPRLNGGRLDRSRFFAWFEFGTVSEMFSGPAKRASAAAFIRDKAATARFGNEPTVLAIVDNGPPPQLLRVEAGKGIEALKRELRRIDESHRSDDSLELVLATEDERGSLGWLLYGQGTARSFWPALPEQYRLVEGQALAEAEFHAQMRVDALASKDEERLLNRVRRRFGLRTRQPGIR